MPRESDYDPDLSLPYLVVRLGLQLTRSFGKLMAEAGLTPRQFGIMAHVCKTDGIGSAEIARRLGVTPQGTGEQIEAMVARGLLRRDRARPGLKAGIHLTAKGKRVLSEATALAMDFEDHVTGGLDREELAEVRAALAEMARRA